MEVDKVTSLAGRSRRWTEVTDVGGQWWTVGDQPRRPISEVDSKCQSLAGRSRKVDSR